MSTKNPAKSLFGFSLPVWLNALIGLVSVPLVTRVLDPEVMGKFNLFCTYGSLLGYVALAGLDQAYMRFYNEPLGETTSGGLFKLCAAMSMGITLAVSVAILIFGDSISTVIAGKPDYMVVLCLVVFVVSYAPLNMISSTYRMQNMLVAYGIVTVLMSLFVKITYVGAVYSKNQFISAIMLLSGSYLILAVVFSISAFQRCRKERIVFKKPEVTQILSYALPLLPVTFLSQINSAIPKTLISSLLDYSQVGIYAAANSIVGIVSIVHSGVSVFWLPFVFEHYATHPQYLRLGQKLIAFTLIMFCFGVILFQDVFYLIIGESYREGQRIFPMLLFSAICLMLCQITGVGISISKKTYLNIGVYLAAMAATYGCCHFAIPHFGLTGAAVAAAAAALLMLILETVIGQRYFKIIDSPFKTIFLVTLFLIVVVMNTVFFDIVLIRSLITAVSILVCCVIYRKELVWIIRFGLRMLKGNVG